MSRVLSPSLISRARRQSIPTETNTDSSRPPISRVLAAPPSSENEWTLKSERTPVRVRNDSYIAPTKGSRPKNSVGFWKPPRTRWIWAACRKAIRAIQGTNGPFSTGSHSQKPPQPSIS